MHPARLSWILAALAAAAVASQSAAQLESAAEEAEREAARERAAFERERAAVERELAREQANAERERAAAEREHAREQAAAQREMASELARIQRLSTAELAAMQRELAQAREEMERAVGDVARLSVQMREPALQTVQQYWRQAAGGRGVLGLNIEDTDLGVVVRGVTPNGPAATAGIAVGDTIVSINDVELARTQGGRAPSAALFAQVGTVVPGDEVRLRVLRDGDYRDVVVRAGDNRVRTPYVFLGGDNGSWPAGAWTRLRYSGAWNDMELVALTPGLGEYFGTNEGLLVLRAGRAAELGFRDGDVIIDLDGRKPQSAEHALRILASFEPGESLQAAIMRQRRREALPIRIPTASD
jgi:chemotaxis protein histidine kinase CheA